jgi:hypothetical protein
VRRRTRPATGAAYTCTSSTPAPLLAPRSMAQPTTLNGCDTVEFGCGPSMDIAGDDCGTPIVMSAVFAWLNAFATVLNA